jgi:hypothetical protein
MDTVSMVASVRGPLMMGSLVTCVHGGGGGISTWALVRASVKRWLAYYVVLGLWLWQGCGSSGEAAMVKMVLSVFLLG